VWASAELDAARAGIPHHPSEAKGCVVFRSWEETLSRLATRPATRSQTSDRRDIRIKSTAAR